MNLSLLRVSIAAALAGMAAPARAEETEDILKKLSGITGLAMLKPVNQITMKREQLKDYFDQRIKEVVKPEEIRLEELALKKMGFAPADFDLKKPPSISWRSRQPLSTTIARSRWCCSTTARA